MRLRTLLVFFVSWLVTVALGAQYIAPGGTTSGRGLTEEEKMRESLEQARWRLGVIRVEPWIGVRDASLVSSSMTTDEDVTATVGAGLRGYLKTGRRVILAAHVMPEYVWWQSDSEKESLNGRYGLGLFGYFNRLDLELSLRREEAQGFFSPEVQELTSLRTDRARFGVELELATEMFLYGEFSTAEIRGEEKGTVFTSLDRDTESAQIGLRYRSPRGWWASVGVEDLEEDFAERQDVRSRSHTGDVSAVGLGYESPNLSLNASVESRSLEPVAGSGFVDLETTTGHVETVWRLHRAVDLFAYGRRQVGFSVLDENSSILTDRYGLRFDFRLGDSQLDLVAEIGEDDYQPATGALVDRLDEVTAFGALLAFKVRQAFIVRLGGTHTEYDSNLGEFDRDVTAWTVTIQLGSLRGRLRLGDAHKVW